MKGREQWEREKVEEERQRAREVVRQEKQVERARRDRSVQIIVCSSEWNQCMLNSVDKFQNALLVTNWKITLIFFWFPFQVAVFEQSEEERGGVRWIGTVFIYLFIFVNRFFLFICTIFHHHHY